MARVPLQKVRIVGLKHHSKVLFQELHRRGVMEVTENKNFAENSISHVDADIHQELFDSFDLARIDFAIQFLIPFAPKKPKMESLLTGDKLIMSEEKALAEFNGFSSEIETFVTECEKLQAMFVQNQNEIKKLTADRAQLETYLSYSYPIQENLETEATKTIVFRLLKKDQERFFEKLAEKTTLFHMSPLHEAEKDIFLTLTFAKGAQADLDKIIEKLGGEVIEISALFADYAEHTPKEAVHFIDEKVKGLAKEIAEGQTRQKKLAKKLDKLQICHDFFTWRKNKNETQKSALRTKSLFALEGWMARDKFSELAHWMKQAFAGEVELEKIKPSKEEKEPALIKNKPGIASFQMVTEMFGAPKQDELDPTPIMAPFFVVFFGVCLSDVGYGGLLALISGFFLAFGTFSKEAKEKLVMIFLCGVSAIIGGILLGGWFGMTPEQFPLLANPATGDFYGQILNPLAGNGAMTFLTFSFGIGVIQLLVGVFMDGVKRLKNGDTVGAWADSFAWLYFLLAIIFWALADTFGLPKDILQYAVMGGAGILILTQGREKKNIVAKLLFGVLGLYGIMDYISNMLSYSRLMALGLATGIIGAAMNTTAGVLGELITVPVLGTVIAIFFVLFGHSLNFALSLLGAFIHSMRLQFIEFFGRFYAGGGKLFRPFKRTYKYLYLRD